MNLGKLVPPVELCKLIPAGEFEDAAFAWHYTDMVGFVCRTSGCEQVSGKEWQLVQSNASRIIRTRKRGEQIYPAPTLEENLDALFQDGDGFDVCVFWDGGWHVRENGNEEYMPYSKSTAALKLWLKLKGVEA